MDHSQASAPDMPYGAFLGIGLLTCIPIWFAFQTDSHILVVLSLVMSCTAVLWLLRAFVRIPHLYSQTAFLLAVSILTLVVTRNMYFTLITIVWLWIGLVTFWIFSSWSEFSDFVKKIPLLLLGTQTLLAISGIWTFFRHGERATGWMTNANGLGGVLLWGVLLGAALVLSGYRRKWMIPITVTIFVAWLLTISLTAFVAALVPAALLLWLYRKQIRWKIVLALFTLCIVGFTTIWLTGQPKRLVQLMTSQHVTFSFTQRLEFDRVALKMWQAKPWTGWGLGSYRQTFPRFTTQYNEQPLYAHNVYLQVLAETGIIGGLGWLAIVGYIGWCGWKLVRRQEKNLEGNIIRGLFLGWLAFSLHAAVDFSWYFPAGLVWWLCSSALFFQRTRNSNQLQPRTIWQAVTVGVVSIVFIGIGLVTLRSVQASDRGTSAKDRLDDDQAIQYYNEAIRWRGSVQDVQSLAQVYWVRRQGDDLKIGETLLRKSLHRNQDNYFLHNALGHNLDAQQRDDEAIAEYRRAYQLDPLFHPQFATDYIQGLKKDNQLEQAKEELQIVLQRYGLTQSSNPVIARDFPMVLQLKTELLPNE